MDKEIKTYQIDFEKNQSMAFTSPLAYRFYRKQEKQVENWRDLYAAVLSDLARSFAEKFSLTDSVSILPQDEIGDLKQSKKMKKPVSIRRGVYVETDLNTETLLRRIRSVLDECNLPYTHLSITYLIDEERKAQYLISRKYIFWTGVFKRHTRDRPQYLIDIRLKTRNKLVRGTIFMFSLLPI